MLESLFLQQLQPISDQVGGIMSLNICTHLTDDPGGGTVLIENGCVGIFHWVPPTTAANQRSSGWDNNADVYKATLY